VFIHSPASVTANLAAGTASGWGTDTFTSIEGVIGSPLPDVLIGEARDNGLDGFDGADTLDAGPGNDELDGEAGDDVLNGGPGIDLVYYDYSPHAIRASLATRTGTGWGSDRFIGVEALHGSKFGDRLTGDGRANLIDGHGGNDVIAGGPGNDDLFGGPGRDRVDGGPGRDRCRQAEIKKHCP
jgi:Ca2+-binding RTX toxin-like protein